MKTEDKQVDVQADVETTENEKINEPEVVENFDAAICKPEREKVDKAIRDSVYASMGLGVVPLAWFNFPALAASNLNLVRKLSKLYRVEFKESAAKKILIAATGAGTGTLAAPVVGTLVSAIPLVGLPLTVGTMPLLSGMTTYAVGRMFVTHFERGGGFVGANLEAMKEDFSDAYKNSRQWIGDKISGKKETEPVNA